MDTTIGVSFLDPLNDYELIRRIGSGTYGDVFKARNIKSSAMAAIKIVKLDPGDDITSIQQEITMMKECKHKNIVAYFGSYHRNTKLWICMEYCGGGSLQDIYHVTGPLKEKQIAYICRETLQVSHVVKINHSQDILDPAFCLPLPPNCHLCFHAADFGVAAEISASVAKRKSFIGTPYWMAPEVAAVEKKGGYNHLCDIWAVGITAIELAELQPPMFDLHPMRALMLMSKSSFQPPRLKDKTKWSAGFQSFVKMSLIKNPRKRPSSETLLQHPFVTQLLTRNLIIELLDMANNPDLHSTHDAHAWPSPRTLRNIASAPDKIQSAGKHLPVERTLSEQQCESSNPYTIMTLKHHHQPTHDIITTICEKGYRSSILYLLCVVIRIIVAFLIHAKIDNMSQHDKWVLPSLLLSCGSLVLARCSATQDISRQWCSDPSVSEGSAVQAEKKTGGVASPSRETSLSPEWSTLRRKTEDSVSVQHRKMLMGACFSKVFNGCPLKIHCAVTWILPKTRDQYLILGAEEGVYTLNLNELHEDTLEKLLPQRCAWLYVMNNVLMSISGKSSQLYSHSLMSLFEQRGHKQQKQSHLSLSTNRLTERINPRKYAVTVKIPDTKSCRRCSVARNPYTDSTFLCGAVPSGLVLLLWYDPMQKFMQLKHIDIRLPDPLPIFELLVLVTDEFPQLCVGVRDCTAEKGKPPTNQQLKFDIVELNGTPNSSPGGTEMLDATQLDRDTVLIALEKTVKIVTLQGLPSKELAFELVFDFPIETLICLQDSVLAFWKHGLKGRSLHTNEVTQEITDESRVFRVLGTNRDIVLQSTPTEDPSAMSNLYILTGHESSY
uniref:Mitogen-activated protein kinase kinase kinase kinase n=1 Tax=Oncorhynchus mykiss TaxID=8022 RepID=A0A8C7PJZ4_ONCMY